MVFLINSLAQAGVQNNLVNYEMNFISKYGNTTMRQKKSLISFVSYD